MLLLSELLTNAVRHTGVSPGREVAARCAIVRNGDSDSDALRVEVADANDHLPTPRTAAPDDESGRGLALALVEALADAWPASV